MRAYKFLRPGAKGPFSGFAWPRPDNGEPGPWIDAESYTARCRDGIHACRARDLPWWIWEELWVAELDGEVEEQRHKLRAPRGRLVRRVEEWTPATAKNYAEACAWRARDRAVEGLAGLPDAAARFVACDTLEDVRATTAELWDATSGPERIVMGMASDGALRATMARDTDDDYLAAQGGAVCAYIAAMMAGRLGGREAMDEERAWQARWLSERLALE